MANIHITWSVKPNCWNMMASCYGNCYGCGCCVKDKKKRYTNRVLLMEEELYEQKHFSLWDDDPELRKIQEKNVKANVRWINRRLRYYRKKLGEIGGEVG